MPSGRKALDFLRAASESPYKPHSNMAALIITSQQGWHPTPTPRGALEFPSGCYPHLKTLAKELMCGVLRMPHSLVWVLTYNATPARWHFRTHNITIQNRIWKGFVVVINGFPWEALRQGCSHGRETLYSQINEISPSCFKEENKSEEVLYRCVRLDSLGSRFWHGREECERLIGR